MPYRKCRGLFLKIRIVLGIIKILSKSLSIIKFLIFKKMLKKEFALSLLIFVSILSCQYNHKNDKSSSITDSLNQHLEIAKNEALSYDLRDKNNELALNKISKIRNSDINKKQLLNVATNFYNLKNWNSYKKVVDKLYILAIEENDSLLLANSFANYGLYYTNISYNDSAYYYNLKAKKIYEINKDGVALSIIYLNISTSQTFACDYLNAEISALKAMNYARITKRDDLEYASLLSLGIISKGLGDLDNANIYYEKALLVAKRDKFDNSQYSIEACLNNMAFVAQQSKNYDIAIKLYKEVLTRVKECKNHPELYVQSLDNYGYCLFKMGRYDSIPNIFIQTSEIRTRFKIEQGTNYNKLFLSEYYFYRKDTLRAIANAKDALRISKNFKAPSDVLESLKLLTFVDMKKAPIYARTYIRINDSIQLAERRMRNKFARIAYETDEIIVEKDTAIKHKWIILGVAGSVLVLVVLLFIIRLQRAKQLELLLKQQQQEANENIYQLIHDQQFQIDAARRDEKKRISQELHDGVMNQLTSTRLNLFVLNKRKDEETIEKCLSLINGIQNIEREIRQVAHDLNSDVFSATNSFNNLLECLFQEQKLIASAIIHTQIDQEIEWEGMDSVTKMNLYRIIQEALNNCHKYAQATNIFVTIDKPEDTIHIVINDDGIGFDMKKQIKGIGLKNMSERVKTIGGTIDILSEKGKGTTIIVNLAPNNQLPTTHGKKNQYYNC